MSINVNDKNIGHATAYAYAVAGGYTGTEAEFTELLGNIAGDLEQIENLTVTVETLAAGSSATASYSNGVLHLGIPKGDKGEKGDTGATGPTGPTGNGIASVAKTGTSGLVDTYTITYTNGNTSTFTVTNGAEAVDNTLTIAGRAADAKETGDKISELKEDLTQKANIDGSYEDLVSGGAYQIISNMVATDTTPYNYRTAGGSLEIGDREKLKKIVGGSLAVNQLADISLAPSSRNSVTITKNDDSFTMNGTADGYINATGWFNIDTNVINTLVNHVCFISHRLISGTVQDANNVKFRVNGNESGTEVLLGNAKIFKSTTQGNNPRSIYSAESGTVFTNAKITINLIDLTAMFGTTIADYVYGLETANAGDGVAWLKSHFPKIFDAGYIPYNAGTLEHVSGLSAHKMVGFNQFDGELERANVNWTTYIFTPSSSGGRWASKNYIPVLPNATYYISHPTNNLIVGYTDDSGSNGRALSNNGTNTHIYVMPGDVHYIKFGINETAEPTNICISLHWDGERDGEYEPYEEHSYPLDSDVTLRGIPKLDANNNLYYDGDEYTPDGTVTRRYGIVDLGTLDWNYVSDNVFRAPKPSDAKTSYSGRCAKYYFIGQAGSPDDKQMSSGGSGAYVIVKDTAYSDAATFKTAMSGVYLVYELATPTTETADPYTEIQNVSNWGTEEFVTTSLVPVGHETAYQPDLRAKIEVAPESPDTDGLYLMKRENGQNSYVAYLGELPSDPTTDGTYTLKATVSSGTVTKTWEADT